MPRSPMFAAAQRRYQTLFGLQAWGADNTTKDVIFAGSGKESRSSWFPDRKEGMWVQAKQ